MIEKGRTIEKYLSSSDPVTSPETSKLWTRIKGETKSIESDMNLIERELVENPKSVFFGPTLGTRLRFKSIPCYIESASESLYKESWFCPPVSEASREVANLTESKNPHTPEYSVKEFVRLSVCFTYT